VAEKAGLLTTIASEGQEVKIGEVVATIDETAAAPKAGPETVATPTDVKDKPDPNREEAPVSGEKKSPNAEILSPAVRRIVTEEKLETAEISGSGKGGRLTKGDVLTAAQNRSTAPAPRRHPRKAQRTAPILSRPRRRRTNASRARRCRRCAARSLRSW
jgi:2-oxoglutarate dehydrogenase E2 component (dihydrolipoamide succinyltransferase)